MGRSEYEEQAEQFLTKYGLVIRIAFKGDKCPAWEEGDLHIHGDRYRVTIKRDTQYEVGQEGRMIHIQGKSISFDFWNSKADSEEKKRPTAYDILSTVGSDAFSPTNPDKVAAEFGDMKPSQAIAIARFAKRLQAFFTKDELETVSEIQ